MRLTCKVKFDCNSFSHWSGAKESREIECMKLEHSVFKTVCELPQPNPNK